MKLVNMPKPKKGQVWERKKDGKALLIKATKGTDVFYVVDLLNQKVQHHVTKRDLWIYWTLKDTIQKYGH